MASRSLTRPAARLTWISPVEAEAVAGDTEDLERTAVRSEILISAAACDLAQEVQ